ncbi:MAG TPA: transglutaminase domain-containing protein [Bacilli bacterium]|nr:transglutaminase domain-containing protein [Bacilli bacterium]
MKRKVLFVFLLAVFGVLFFNYKVEAKSFEEFYNDYASMNFSQKVNALHNSQEIGNKFYYNTLDEYEKEIYDAFLSAIRVGYPFEVVIEQQLGDTLQDLYNAAFEAWKAFNLDHPEYFWFNNNIEPDTSRLGFLIVKPRIEVGYLNDGEYNQSLVDEDLIHILARRAYLKQEVDLLQNDYQKLRYLYTWLIQNNEYDTNSSKFAHVPSGALIKSDFGKDGSLYEPVCEAYAEAFQMLANYCNIPVITTTGQAYGSGGWENHAWSHAFMIDKWYFTDVTFGDPIGEHLSPDYVDYDYFLAAPSNEHVIKDEAYSPSPLSNIAFDPNLLQDFYLETQENYVYNGHPIKGYEKLYILANPNAAFTISYFDSNNILLGEMPSAIGSYTIRARGALGSGFETLSINFNFNILAPEHNTVVYYDKDGNVLASIPYNLGDEIPNYEAPHVNGYKFISWNYITEEYNVYAHPMYQKIVITFEDLEGNSIDYDFTDVSALYESDLLNDIEKDPGYLIMGWEINGELLTEDSQITDDATLKPLIKKINYTIDGMTKKAENVFVGSVFKSEDIKGKIVVEEGVQVTTPFHLSEMQDGKQMLTITFVATKTLDKETIVAEIQILEVQTFNETLDWVKNNYIWVLVGLGVLIALSIVVNVVERKRKKGKTK